LETLNKALPEFFEVSAPQGLVDRAFHDSIVAKNTDMKHWKAFREEFLAQHLRLTPREISRLKFALSRKGNDLSLAANFGRTPLHSKLEEDVRQYLPHMTAQELLSVMFGFSRTGKLPLYEAAYERLKEEIKEETSLDVLAIAPYVVAKSIPWTKRTEHWYPHTAHNLDFVATVTPMLLNRLTEFSSNQLATICSGLSTMDLNPKRRLEAEELVSSIETEILYRRVSTLSGENLVDVLKSFAAINLGSDQLFSAFREKLAQTLEEVDIDAAVDLAHALTSRELLGSDVLGRFNKRLVKEMSSVRRAYVGKLAEYLFYIQTTDKPLLESFVKFVEGGLVPLSHYTKVRDLRLWIKGRHPSIVSPLFTQMAEKKEGVFWVENLVHERPEYKTKEFLTMQGILQNNLGYQCLKEYTYQNLFSTDFAFMPQKLALHLAQPDFHLVGKVEYDHRIVKEPAIKYKPKHSFKMKGEALKLYGWKVVDLNYHELMENQSREEREKLLKDTLTKHGVQPREP
jgi:hypothetical protein